MRRPTVLLRSAIWLFCGVICSAQASGADGLLRPADRIVFVGDSITGHGGQGNGGWVAQIGSALKQQNAANHQTLIPLGGSGQTVGSWVNVEKRSRAQETRLDVKQYDLREELNQHADVVIIMLGMNDVLSAGLSDTAEGIQKWKESYVNLIAALRERTTPRLIALATPTPCTEDPRSPKNRVMDRMVQAMRDLAQQEHCTILPTRETAWEVLQKGRERNPRFHIAADQVHPSSAGHAMIAAGMLRGLGEEQAARKLIDKAVNDRSAGQSLSYQWYCLSRDQTTEPVKLRLEVYRRGDTVQLELPDGWTATPAESENTDARYDISAKLDRLENTITIRSGSASCEATIPAPWLVSAANTRYKGWNRGQYDVEDGKLPIDDAVRTGVGFSKAMAKGEFAPGIQAQWKTFVGNINYGGSGNPAVVDFAQVTYFRIGETGYGLRWIKSDKDRPVRIKIARPGFAGSTFAQVWLNGQDVYAGNPIEARRQTFGGNLHKGWNLLSFKTNFWQWQWQLSIDLEAKDGDSLDALRYSITPR